MYFEMAFQGVGADILVPRELPQMSYNPSFKSLKSGSRLQSAALVTLLDFTHADPQEINKPGIELTPRKNLLPTPLKIIVPADPQPYP